MCRLTVLGPTSQIELAVPVHIALTDLMPTILGHVDGSLAVNGLQHGGWVLQRVGEPPLDEDLGTAALGLRDGDLLCLRPRDDQLAPVDFDDLIDGVASGIRDRPNRWRRELTRRLFLAAILPVLGVGALGLLLPGPAVLRAGAAGFAAAMLVAGVLATARALGDKSAAIQLGLAAVGYAAVAGMLVPADLSGGGLVGAAQTLAGSALAVSVSLILVGAAATAKQIFGAVAVAGAMVGSGALVALLLPVGGPGGAGVSLALALALGALVPAIAFRIAGLRLPALPTTTEEFQEDLDPEPAKEVLDRTARADRTMDALYGALGTVCAGTFTVLLLAPGWYGQALVGVASVLLVLHSRVLRGARQRLGGTLPGLYGLLGLGVVAVYNGGPLTRLVTPVAVIVVASLAAVGATTLPGRRSAPYWGRAAEISQTMLAMAVVPLLVGVLGGYTYVRGLGG